MLRCRPWMSCAGRADEGNPVSSPGYSVLLVHSVSWAIRIERILGGRAIPCRLVPVPRHLSSDCGVCVRVARADVSAVLAAVQEEGAELESIHEI